MAVYFIQAGEGGPVKIGVAADPVERLASLQTGCPDELRIIRLVRGDAPTETEMHIRFASLRLRGEWFAFSDEMLSLPLDDLPLPIKSPRHLSRFAQWLFDAGLSDSAAAERFGCSAMQIGRLKRGLHIPRLSLVQRIEKETDGAVCLPDLRAAFEEATAAKRAA